MDAKIGEHEPDRWKKRWIRKQIAGGTDGLRPERIWMEGQREVFKRTDFRLDIIESKAERIDKWKGMWTYRQIKLRI